MPQLTPQKKAELDAAIERQNKEAEERAKAAAAKDAERRAALAHLYGPDKNLIHKLAAELDRIASAVHEFHTNEGRAIDLATRTRARELADQARALADKHL